MKRWLGLALVAAMVAVPAAAGASWLHTGYDPARTGDIPFSGPATDDVALEVHLPGSVVGTPLVDNGSAYVLTEARPDLREDLTEDALWRLDLGTGETEKLVDLVGRNATIAPSLDLVVSQDGSDLVAQAVPSGEERWRADSALARNSLCSVGNAAIGDVVFHEETAHVPQRLVCQGTSVQTFSLVRFVNATSGEQRSPWWRSDAVTSRTNGTQVGTDGAGMPVLSVGDERVYAAVHVVNRTEPGPVGSPEIAAEDPAGARQLVQELWGVAPGPASAEWREFGTPHSMASIAGFDPGDTFDEVDPWRTQGGGGAVVGDNLVFARLDEVTAFNPARGDGVWRGGTGDADRVQVHGALSIGLGEGTLVATSAQTAYGFDARSGEPVWERLLDDATLVHGVEPTAVSDETAWIPTYRISGEDAETPLPYGVDARSLADGSLQWRWQHTPDVGPSDHTTSQPAFGEGFLVWGGPDGTVHVIGETEASPEPVVELSTRYPSPGDTVEVDLSGSEAGALGPVTFHGADWGDGSPVDEQQDPVLTHTYEDEGDMRARLVVGNEEGQTASAFVTFHVGASEPNWIEERFQKENQDMTFGVLGLAVALGGGAIGVARRKRKQSILQEELETLEQGFEDSRDNPGECEAFLDTRKARARSLMMDGTLDEEQFGVIESRVEELGRELRTSVLDDRFQFLPYGLVQSLKKMLADGKISTWEREAVETLLEDEDALSEAQKEKVRHQLDRWLVEDAGGDAA